MGDFDVARLESVAQQLVARVHDDDPDANHRWLHAVTTPSEREALLYLLAAAVPTDRTWRDLTGWADHIVPVDSAVDRRAEMLEALNAERFGPRPGRWAA